MDQLLWLLALLIGLGGFAVGWAARTDTNRRYEESRDAHRAHQLALALQASRQGLAEALEVPSFVPAAAPAVVHVHLDVPSLSQGWTHPRVIDAQIVPALEASVYDH